MAKDPRDEVRRILAQMKAGGVTISSRPGAGREADFRDRAMGVIDEEARALDMTFDEENDRG